MDFSNCVGETYWPQYRGDVQVQQVSGSSFTFTHAGYNPSEQLLSPSTVPNLQTYWQTHLGGSIATSSPAVANGIVYIGTTDGTGGHSLYALDAQTGTELWHAATGGQIYSTPAVVSGIVYVGSVDGNLYAFDARTGARLWQAPACGSCTGGGLQSSPVVATVTINNRATPLVYVGSYDKKLYALKADGCGQPTCQPLWATAATGSSIESTPAVATFTINGASTSFVYVGSDDNNLYAFDATTGALKWTAPTRGSIASSPAVATFTINGVPTSFVYISSQDGNLYAFDANGVTNCQGSPPTKTCTPLWQAYDDGYHSSPAVATVTITGAPTQVVYIGAGNGYLYAFDATGGANYCSGTPKTCTPLWPPVQLGGILVGSSPTVANGVVYVGSQDYNGSGNRLYALAADNGKQLWMSDPAADFIYSSPTVANGVVYVGCADYNVYAYALPI